MNLNSFKVLKIKTQLQMILVVAFLFIYLSGVAVS